VLLAIGSPALAAYSLAVTHLNSSWISHKFRDLKFPNNPNKGYIPLALSALQHIPVKIDASGSLLPSLIALHQNDRYWEVLGKAAKRTRQLSIPVAMNIIWALVAFLLTIVDSFVDFDHFITVPGDAGYSIAIVWTYLLPLVIGWLHVGCQPDADYLCSALNNAHETAYVAESFQALATQVARHSAPAIDPSTSHVDYVNADEKKTVPIFNYSRVFIWSQNAQHILRLYKNAASNAVRKIPVQGGTWMNNNNDRTGNEAEVMQYCMDDRMAPFNPNLVYSSSQIPTHLTPYSAFPQLPEPSTETPLITGTNENSSAFAYKYDKEARSTEVPEKPVFATEVFLRVVFATILALVLQWGTTGASLLIHLNTPPKGLGCRALTFTLYGAAATVAFLLLLFSSIISHLVRPQSQKRSGMNTLIGCIAAGTRWLGKFIAIMNAFGILLSCIMQFAGVYDNCFCSSMLFRGNSRGFVSFTEENIKRSEVYSYWIGGIIMACWISGLYTFAIYVATPMRQES